MKANQASKYVPNFFRNHQVQTQDQPHMITNRLTTPFPHLTPLKQIKNLKGLQKIIKRNPPSKQSIEQQQSLTTHRQNTNKTVICDISQIQQQQQSIDTGRLFRQSNKRHVVKINLDELDSQEVKTNSRSQTTISQNKIEESIQLSNFNRINKLNIEDLTEQSEFSELHQLPISQKNINVTIPKTQEFDYYANQINLFSKIQKGKRFQCIIRRDKKNSDGILQFNIYFQKNKRHILTVKKQGLWKYTFYLRQDKDKSAFTYTSIAVLQSTIFSSKYSLFTKGGSFSDLTICYETNFLGLMGPRKINIYIPKKTLPYEYLDQGYESDTDKENLIKCVNKKSQWSDKFNCYVLNFQGRAGQSSIKNFVITDDKQDEAKFWIIFAKASNQLYNLDIQYPFSILQGVAVAISSFQRKLTCD